MPEEPTVKVSSPDLVLAAGTWASDTQTLEIMTARSMIEEGARVEMLVYNVRTPSCVYGNTSVTNVTSLGSAAHVIDDKTSIAIASVSIGSLGDGLSWTPAAATPAVTSDTSVSFVTGGGISVGGHIEVVLPNVGWSMKREQHTWHLVQHTSVGRGNSKLDGGHEYAGGYDDIGRHRRRQLGSADGEGHGDAAISDAYRSGEHRDIRRCNRACDRLISNVSWALGLNTPGVANNATLTKHVSGRIGGGACIEIVLLPRAIAHIGACLFAFCLLSVCLSRSPCTCPSGAPVLEKRYKSIW
jgi:hypothetical protein